MVAGDLICIRQARERILCSVPSNLEGTTNRVSQGCLGEV